MSAHSYQPNRLWCDRLKKCVTDEVNSPRGMSRIGSLEYRALIILYWILQDHRIDHWGHCQSCRRPGSLFGARWRPCPLHSKVDLGLERLDAPRLLGLLVEQPESDSIPPLTSDRGQHRRAARDRH